MNQLFCHPEIITLKKAVYYDIAPIPLPVPFKDGITFLVEKARTLQR